MNQNRFVIVLMAIGFATVAVTGCSGNTQPTGAPTGSKPTQPAVQPTTASVGQPTQTARALNKPVKLKYQFDLTGVVLLSGSFDFEASQDYTDCNTVGGAALLGPSGKVGTRDVKLIVGVPLVLPMKPGNTYPLSKLKEADIVIYLGDVNLVSSSNTTATVTLNPDGSGKLTLKDLDDNVDKTKHESGAISWTCQ